MQIIYMLLISVAFLLPSCKSKKAALPPGPDGWPSEPVRIIKDDLNYPWEILWGKDDFIWMTERGGKIKKIDPKTGDVLFNHTINDVVSRSEGGLLGMVQHPDFLSNGLFYVVYNYTSGSKYVERLVQMKFANNSIQSATTLIENIPAFDYHNGSRLWISSEAVPKLFMTTGDAFDEKNGQLTNVLAGKILRFNLDGSIPADNPIAGSPIWSFGHRNPQGLVVANGIMYASEHGPDIEDELNIIEKNSNYGWPNVKGPCNDPGEITFCTTNAVKEPIWSSGNVTFAVCGLDYYNNDRIADWKNSLLLTSLKDASLRVLKLSADGRTVVSQKLFYKNKYGRLRDICISPAGRVYLCTSNGSNDDELIEISVP